MRTGSILKSLLRIGIGVLVGLVLMVVGYMIFFAEPREEGCDTTVENRELRFYRDGTEWYADVRGHNKAENRMVAGADDLLDMFSDGKDEIVITFSADVPRPGEWKIHLHLFAHDKFGATYKVSRVNSAIPFLVWLCNVTHTVFGGEHPVDIYVHSIITR